MTATIHEPTVSGTDPLPEPGTIPYFRRELDAAAERWGLDPVPWGPLAA
jgi:hypothetical protein